VFIFYSLGAALQGPEQLKPLLVMNVDMFLVEFDIQSKLSLLSCEQKWIPHLKYYFPGTPFILVGNKCDFRDEQSEIEDTALISEEQGFRVAEQTGAVAYMENSALLNTGVMKIFAEAARTVIKTDAPVSSSKPPKYWPKDLPKIPIFQDFHPFLTKLMSSIVPEGYRSNGVLAKKEFCCDIDISIGEPLESEKEGDNLYSIVLSYLFGEEISQLREEIQIPKQQGSAVLSLCFDVNDDICLQQKPSIEFVLGELAATVKSVLNLARDQMKFVVSCNVIYREGKPKFLVNMILHEAANQELKRLFSFYSFTNFSAEISGKLQDDLHTLISGHGRMHVEGGKSIIELMKGVLFYGKDSIQDNFNFVDALQLFSLVLQFDDLADIENQGWGFHTLIGAFLELLHLKNNHHLSPDQSLKENLGAKKLELPGIINNIKQMFCDSLAGLMWQDGVNGEDGGRCSEAYTPTSNLKYLKSLNFAYLLQDDHALSVSTKGLKLCRTKPQKGKKTEEISLKNTITRALTKHSYTFLVLGPKSVGKTSTLFRFTEDKFPQAVVKKQWFSKEIQINNDLFALKIFPESPCSLKELSLWKADGYILMFSLTSIASFEEVVDFYQSVLQRQKKPIILVGNKAEDVQNRDFPYQPQHFSYLGFPDSIQFFEISAKTGKGVRRSIEGLCKEVSEQQQPLDSILNLDFNFSLPS